MAQTEGTEAAGEAFVRGVVGDPVGRERGEVREQLGCAVQDEGAGHGDRAAAARRELAVDDPCAPCARRLEQVGLVGD
jgi:hypothetical protein